MSDRLSEMTIDCLRADVADMKIGTIRTMKEALHDSGVDDAVDAEKDHARTVEKKATIRTKTDVPGSSVAIVIQNLIVRISLDHDFVVLSIKLDH